MATWTGNTAPVYRTLDTKGGRFPRIEVWEITGADVANGDVVAIPLKTRDEGIVITLRGLAVDLALATSTATSLDVDVGRGETTFTLDTFDHLLDNTTAAAWIENAAPEDHRLLYFQAGHNLLIMPNPDSGTDNDVSIRVVLSYGATI